MQLKPGARLKSAVSETQIMVLRVPAAAIDLRCGGVAMLGLQDSATVEAGGVVEGECLTGKRYTDADETMEFLCTKGGAGWLSVGDVVLGVKQAKQLPSSD